MLDQFNDDPLSQMDYIMARRERMQAMRPTPAFYMIAAAAVAFVGSIWTLL